MATKTSHNSSENDVDFTKASNSLWLVKVPNYIASKWEQQSNGDSIGILNIARRPNEKAEMSLCLLEEILTDKSKQVLPKEYKLNVEPIREQLMTVFSEQVKAAATTTVGAKNVSGGGASGGGGGGCLKVAGYLSQKVNVIPTAEASYMNLKKDSIRQAFIPKRTSMQLDNIVKNFKPITDHVENIENRKKVKHKVRKCKSQEEVMAIIFDAFSKQRFYNIRDLIQITAEPIASLKVVLKEICEYNVKNPNRNMWELKAEYRHYNPETKSEEKS